jgi:hypothetical protein
VDGVSAFTFSPDGAYLAMGRYPPERERGSSGGGQAETERANLGTTIIVRELETGREMAFGNVSRFDWQPVETSHLLAMVISAEDKIGNGIHLYDAVTSELRVLDSSDSDYRNLVWRDDASDLAVLRSKNDEGKEGSTNVILAWIGLGGTEEMRSYDPTTDSSFPADMRTVPFRSLSWSGDGSALFLGISPWEDKIVPPKKEGEGEDEGEDVSDPAAPDDPSTVEIWHWTDVFVMPWQKIHASQDRERTMLAAWHVLSGEFVQLGQDLIEERVTPVPDSDLAVV